MKNFLKAIAVGFGILIATLIVIIGIVFFIFRPDNMCVNHLIENKSSPDKELQVILFSRDCGATTGFSTQISIVNFDYKLQNDDTGNVFVADDDHGAAKSTGEIINLKTKWIDNETLQIEYAKHARIFKNKTSKKGVKIIYKEL